MSMFAKVLIVINGVFSFALCGLLAVLLAHKYDYKHLHRATHRSAEAAKRDLARTRADSIGAEQALGQRLARYSQKRSETDLSNKELDAVVKDQDDKLGNLSREAARLEGQVSDQNDRQKGLTETRSALRTEIANLEKEREDAITEGKGFDQEREKLVKDNFKLLTELRAQEQQLAKLASRQLELEGIWTYIVANYPKLNIPFPIPDVQAAVTGVVGDVVGVNCGRDSGVRVGAKLLLQRGDEFVGVIEVRNVDKERAWGVLVEKGPSGPPQPGDVVKADKTK